MADVLQLAIELRGEDKASGAIAGVIKGIQGVGSEAAKSGGLLGGLTGMLGKVGLAGLGIGTVVEGAKSLVGALTSPIQAASDLSESVNKVGVVFGPLAGAVETFAASAAQNLGLSRQAALEAAGTFGNLFTSLGLGQKPAAGLSTDIVKLASDLASFNNISTGDALEKLKAGLLGESEPLRSVGVNLNEAAVAAKAMEMGLASNKNEISDAAKVQARYALILSQTKNAQGDFANTSTGMANAQRIISASFTDLQAEIGGRLLPVIAPLISGFATALPGAMKALKGPLDAVGGAFSAVADLAGTALKPLLSVLPDLGTALQQALGFFKNGGGDIEVFRGVLTKLLGEGGAQGVITVFTNVAGFFNGTLKPAFESIGAIVRKVLGGDLSGALAGLSGLLTTVGPKLAESVLGWGKALIAWIAPMIPGLLQQLAAFQQAVWTWIGTTAAGLVDKFAPMVGAFLDWVAPMIPPLLAALGGYAASMVGWLTGTALPAIVSKLTEWGTAFVDWIAPRIPPLLSALGGLLGGLGAWLTGTALPAIAEKLSVWGTAFVDWIGPKIPPLLAEAGRLLGEFGGWLTGTALPAIGAKLSEWGAAFVAWIGPKIPPLLAEAGALLSALGVWLATTALPAIVSKLAEWGGAFIAWVGPQIPPLLSALGGLLLQLGGWLLTTALPAIVGKLAEWGGAFVSWIGPKIPPLLAEMGKLLGQLGSWLITTALPAIVTKLAEWGGAFLGWVGKDVLPFIGKELGKFATSVTTWIGDQVKGFVASAAALGTGIVDGMIQGLKDASGRLFAYLLDIAKRAIKSAIGAIFGGADQGAKDNAPAPGTAPTNGGTPFQPGPLSLGLAARATALTLPAANVNAGHVLAARPRAFTLPAPEPQTYTLPAPAARSQAMAFGGNIGGAGEPSVVNVYVTVHGSVQTERDLAASIEQALRQRGRQNNGLNFTTSPFAG